ncbi:hypothetical protein [Cyanobium sp. Morenito 9A2]|nr:hypothetical protein [Cyanobium sp. Morenito 9A2]
MGFDWVILGATNEPCLCWADFSLQHLAAIVKALRLSIFVESLE